jgi:hypothetical protein
MNKLKHETHELTVRYLLRFTRAHWAYGLRPSSGIPCLTQDRNSLHSTCYVSVRYILFLPSLLGRKSSGFGTERREYGRRDPSSWPRDTLYQQNLTLTSPTSGNRSIGIVRSRTEATEFGFFLVLLGETCVPSRERNVRISDSWI